MRTTQKAPDVGIKDLIYIGDDGYFYFVDCPENKHRIAKAKGFRLGANFTIKPQIRYKDEQYQLNRVMYWYVTGEWPEVIKHFDGNASNYRFDNLRVIDVSEAKATASSTSYNIRKRIRSNGNPSYQCRIVVKGKYRFLGTYDDEKTAIFAAWRIRDLLYPNLIAVPDSIKDIVKIFKSDLNSLTKDA